MVDYPRFLTKISTNSVYVTILFGFNTMYVNNRIFLVRINPESWFIFYKAGPGSAGGNTVTQYGVGGVSATYSTNVAQQWGSAFQSLGNAITNTLNAIGSAISSLFNW